MGGCLVGGGDVENHKAGSSMCWASTIFMLPLTRPPSGLVRRRRACHPYERGEASPGRVVVDGATCPTPSGGVTAVTALTGVYWVAGCVRCGVPVEVLGDWAGGQNS